MRGGVKGRPVAVVASASGGGVGGKLSVYCGML
jgi:hypothetical protein